MHLKCLKKHKGDDTSENNAFNHFNSAAISLSAGERPHNPVQTLKLKRFRSFSGKSFRRLFQDHSKILFGDGQVFVLIVKSLYYNCCNIEVQRWKQWSSSTFFRFNSEKNSVITRKKVEAFPKKKKTAESLKFYSQYTGSVKKGSRYSAL